MIQVAILGTRIMGVTLEEAFGLLDELVSSSRKDYVCFCEAHLSVQGMTSRAVREALDKAAYVFPDGVSMTLGARMCGTRLPARLTGPGTMLAYMQHGVGLGYRHFLCGGGEGVAEKLKTSLEEKIPGINIVGTFVPPFRGMLDKEFSDLQEKIHAVKPDIMWVALGAPKQELWMSKNTAALDVPLMLGVGAAFDFHAGVRKWAPAWIRAVGLEWLYRMLTGGRRVFIRNLRFETSFVYYLLKDWVARLINNVTAIHR